MMTTLTRVLAATLLCAGLVGQAEIAAAQGQPFAPAFSVNGQAVTNWQVDQRARFLALLNAPNASRDGARDALIDETLQVQAAEAAGVAVTPEELEAGLTEFAARGGLEPTEFVSLLEQRGVAPETFRDFVRNGLAWRNYVQGRFGPIARPDRDEVVRAATRSGDRGDVRVLLSEIAIPQTPETRAEVAALASRLSETISGQAAFEAEARRVSRAPSAPRGGRIDWLDLSTVPPRIGDAVLALAPGEVSEPVDLGGFTALFLLRDLDESGAVPTDASSIDYAEYRIPGGRSPEALAQAGRIAAVTDSCDDLYPIARGTDPDRLRRETAAPAAMPADLRQVLATLDAGEVSTVLTGGGDLRLVMLCDRVAASTPSEESLQRAGQAILSRRLTALAEGHLEELRAEAIITDG
jgi:peptidyl-prolyl cis-trans isomerase SurA